ARKLPRGDPPDIQGRLLPAAAQLLSLGHLRRRNPRPRGLSLAVLGDVAGLAAREAVRVQGPPVRDLGDRHPDGVRAVLLLLRVRRPLAQSPVLCAHRVGDLHAPVRRYDLASDAGTGTGVALAEARRAGGGVSVRIALFAPLLGTGG